MPDWAYAIIAAMVLYAGLAFQIHRQKTIEAGFSLVREEMARFAGNEEHAEKIREDWREDRARERGAIKVFLIITAVVGAMAGATWWLAMHQQWVGPPH
jgi:hypothetical protein